MNDNDKRDLTELVLAVVTILLGALLIVGLVVFPAYEARGAELDPPCGTTPTPPHQLELPDGTVIPVHSYRYDIDTRRTVVTGAPRLFCDGFEGN